MVENNIPSHVDEISARQKRMQETIFRIAARDHGLTLKAISMDAGISYTTIQSYANGSSVMSIASLFRLVGVIPNDLLSLLLPEGQRIVTVSEGIDHDTISEAVTDYLRTKEAAHRIDSECGPAIGPNEDMTLRGKFAVVTGGKAA